MSRVLIQELYYDLHDSSNESWRDAKDFAIVPRKMVEMIIEECDENAKMHHSYGNFCAEQSLTFIKEYAEDLLKQFEEDKE